MSVSDAKRTVVQYDFGSLDALISIVKDKKVKAEIDRLEGLVAVLTDRIEQTAKVDQIDRLHADAEADKAEAARLLETARVERSEERRVGKECRFWWSPYH